jgi:hypothetical protein
MGVAMNSEALGGGATAFARSAEALHGHATSVSELAALRAAFAGSGETVWPAVEARLTALMGRLDAVSQGATHAGTVLWTAATGSTAIDQINGNNLRT